MVLKMTKAVGVYNIYKNRFCLLLFEPKKKIIMTFKKKRVREMLVQTFCFLYNKLNNENKNCEYNPNVL